ncbi:MAG: hypothetical protein L0Y71_16290 [Gemmataceae bacterium]|nr:hypothetical protein [Gemmataceae bacterium]
MDKKPSANADELGRRLQEKLRRERPRWVRWTPIVVIVLLGALLLLAWLLYPPPDPPRVTATALDALVPEGEPAAVRVYLDPVDADAKARALAGFQAIFWIDQGAAGPENAVKAVTDDRGLATATLDIPDGPASAVYQVRHTAPSKKHDSPTSRGAIHRVAKDAPLLLVDVEETVADLDPGLWTKTNPLSIAPRPGAANALREVRPRFTIVYLAVVNTPAKEYRRVQNWVRMKAADPKGLPGGPVLGRLSYDSADVGEARRALLSDCRERFTGTLVAVVRTAEAAEQCLALGIRAIAMGGGDFPGNVTRVKAWDELPAALAK